MNVAFAAKEWMTAHMLKCFRRKPPAYKNQGECIRFVNTGKSAWR